MLSRIEVEKSKKQLDEIIDLNLDNCENNDQLEDSIKELTSLQSLSLVNVGLTTLKGFPALPHLQSLNLSNNELSGTLGCLSGCPALSKLNLTNNKMKTVDSLSPLANMTHLTVLDLVDCEITKDLGYREKVFRLIPSLQYLDGLQKDGKKISSNGAGDALLNTGNGNGAIVCSNLHESQGDNENAVIDDKEDAIAESSINTNDTDDEDEVEEEDSEAEDSEEESEEEIGLDYLNKDDIEDDEDDDDYEEEDDQEDIDIVDDEDEEPNQRGVKRKLEDNSD